jgi:hypothetical protein
VVISCGDLGGWLDFTAFADLGSMRNAFFASLPESKMG